MGLYDRIKRSVMQITGKDPEASQDGSLYRYANRKDSLAAQIGTVPFDHFGFQPDALPPGWVFDSTGKLYPIVRATVSGGWTAAQYPVAIPFDLPAPAQFVTGFAATMDRHTEDWNPWGSSDGAQYTSSASVRPGAYTSFAFAATADGAGAIASTAFLASAGAGKKWQIGYIAIGSVGTAVAPAVVISDSIGTVPLNVSLYWGRKQATAATAITIAATGLTAAATLTIIGQARAVA